MLKKHTIFRVILLSLVVFIQTGIVPACASACQISNSNHPVNQSSCCGTDCSQKSDSCQCGEIQSQDDFDIVPVNVSSFNLTDFVAVKEEISTHLSGSVIESQEKISTHNHDPPEKGFYQFDSTRAPPAG